MRTQWENQLGRLFIKTIRPEWLLFAVDLEGLIGVTDRPTWSSPRVGTGMVCGELNPEQVVGEAGVGVALRSDLDHR